MCFARLPLLGFGNGDVFGDDVDVALRRHDVAAHLAISVAGHDVHITVDAAHGGARSAGAGAGLIGALHAAADGHADGAPAAEESAAGALADVLFAGCFFDRDDVDIASGYLTVSSAIRGHHFDEVLDLHNTGRAVHADKAYPSRERHQMLQVLGFVDAMQRRARAGQPLSECQKWRNQRIASKRAQVEHVFAGIRTWDGQVRAHDRAGARHGGHDDDGCLLQHEAPGVLPLAGRGCVRQTGEHQGTGAPANSESLSREGLQGPSMHDAQTAVGPHRACKTAGLYSCLFGSVSQGV